MSDFREKIRQAVREGAPSGGGDEPEKSLSERIAERVRRRTETLDSQGITD